MKSVVFGSKFIIILLLLNYCNVSFAISKYFMEKATIDHNKRNEVLADDDESTSAYWKSCTQTKLRNQLLRRVNNNVARNVIYFIGDGMSISTVTAARIYNGQLKGHRGEEQELSFDKFPYTGLSKTYCLDSQTADSSCAATALFSGVNGNFLTGGVTGNVVKDDCEAALIEANQVNTIFKLAQKAGKGTGLVTNTRITHATPAVTYSHSSNRNFECDSDVFELKGGVNTTQCRDIAQQMIRGEVGKRLKVIFGGGRSKFLPKQETDVDGAHGARSDGKNLINQWKSKHARGVYVTNKSELENINLNTTDHILGLFASDHMSYTLDADPSKEPTLKQMTETAINLLKKESNGFLLIVEGGRIDHGHHEAWARKALDETVYFSDAIQAAVDLTNEDDTLIVVTSDHSHTLTLSGYADRGSDVLGLATINKSGDELPYTILSYANGPGNELNAGANGLRKDLSGKTLDKTYRYTGTIPNVETTHAGEDVGVFARGPQSHLFTGTYHQTVIPAMISYATCIGDGLTKCKEQ